MTTDPNDRLDELVIRAAGEYNAPTRVPREEMWARIAEARNASQVHARRDGQQRGRNRAWFWPAIGIAATLVLAAGITIGRRLERSASPAALGRTANALPGAATDSTRTPKEQLAQRPDSLITALREQTRATEQSARDLAALAARGGAGDGNASANETNLATRLVVLRHLAGSEAMITAFRESSRRGAVDVQIAAWSRELLRTTRMLESSSTVQDPTMRRLLDDLDLVITQIVRYATRGTHDADELQLIEQSINQRGILPKLRSTIPAGNGAAGT